MKYWGAPMAGGLVTDGLSVYYDFGNAACYPEAGNVAYDLTTGNEGTLAGATAYSSSYGGIMVLGTTGYIDVANMPGILRGTAAFSVCMFASFVTTPTTTLRALYSFGSSPEFPRDILLYSQNGVLEFQVGNGTDGGNKYPYTSSGWVYVAAVYDGSQATPADRGRLYLNGALQVPSVTFSYPTTFSTSTVNTASSIGRYSSDGGGANRLQGSVGPFMLYNRAITAAEVSRNFDHFRSRFSL